MIINVVRFFYKFLVYCIYKDKLTLVNYHGLGKLNITLISVINTPAYI